MKKNDVRGRSVPILFNSFIRMMKLCILFTVVLQLSVIAGTNAQWKKVSLSMENAELRQVLKKLKQQTGLRFFYNEEKLKREGRRCLEIRDMELDEALEEIFQGTVLTYTFLKDVVVIKDREEKPGNMEALMLQKRLVRGIVKDEKGTTLPGVSVIVKGTQTGVATDVDGRFEIKVDDDPNLVLQFSFVGMNVKEIRIGNNQELDVVLETATANLDEVIVTGYQTISKERATGSFGTVTTKNIEAKLQPDLVSLIEGQVAGVVIDKTGKVEIRGVSTFNAQQEPLVVVDGYPIEGGLESLNPENIMNITVLKDGVAASIYGSRAANGVIVVTTKRGEKGSFNVTYKGIFGAVLRPDLSVLNKASSSDYIDAELDLFRQDPNGPSTMDKSGMSRVTWLMMQVREGNITESEAMSEIEELRKIDGLKQAEEHIFRPQLSHQHNLSINGGTDQNQYNVAVNYLNGRRNMIHSDHSRLIMDMKNDWNPNKYIRLGVIAHVVYATDNQPTKTWKDITSYTSESAVQPYDRIVDKYGKPVDVFSTSTYKIDTYKNTPGMKVWNYNPIEDLGKSMVKMQDLQVRLGGNLRVNIIEGLNVEVGGVWTRGNQVTKTTHDKDSYTARIAYNDATSKTNTANHYIPDGAIIDESRNINGNWTFRTQINFNRSFKGDKHRVTALAGNEVRQEKYDNNTYATRVGYNPTAGTFIPVNIKEYNSGIKDIDMLFGRTTLYTMQTGSSSIRDNRFVSWYGNGSYEFDDRYLISGSIRLDLTNFFGTDSKYRYKPLWSVGATWKLAEEKFFSVSWINRLNLRASYGVNGNISLSEGPFLILSAGNYQDVTGGVSYSVAAPPNNQLRWEKTATTNIGADFSVWNNRINLSLDYYYKNSTDLLAKDAADPTTGFSSLTKNIGAMTNKGVEVSIDADVIKKQSFVWHANFNFTYNRNKVKEYNVKRTYAAEYMHGAPLVKGYEANALFAYRYACLNSNGEVMVWNADGEKISAQNATVDDIVYMGTVRPKSDLSFTNSFKYKNIGLSFMLIAKLGHKFRQDAFTGSNYQNRHVAERWQKPGDEATKIYPKLLSWNMDISKMPNMDILVDNASYMKLRDVTITYTFPRQWITPIGLNQVQAYFQARNLLKVTAKGVDIDPEIAELYDSSNGYDGTTDFGYTSLPLRPEFYIGLSFNF